MCTYLTERAPLQGAAKGPGGWFTLTDACVYVDHPQFSCDEHTLNIDFRNSAAGASARVAVELRPESARTLIACIQAALRSYEGAG
jgi:Family of unknown function (DUF6295)